MARFTLGGGALTALGLTLYTGRNNSSVLLVTLFAVWVISPFLGFAAARRWARRSRGEVASATDAASIVVALCSVAIYAVVAFGPPLRQTAFAFLVVPGASWLAILPVLFAVWLGNRQRGHARGSSR